MPTKRKLKCLESLPTEVARSGWRTLQERKAAWVSVVQKFTPSAREHDIRPGQWGPLFDIPDRLGSDAMRDLAALFFAYLRAYEATFWCTAFGAWAKDLEDDMNRIRTGYTLNPKAGYRAMAPEALRLLIWERDIRGKVPDTFWDVTS